MEKTKQVRSKIYSKKKINMNSNEDIKSALKAQSSATEMKSMNSKTRQLQVQIGGHQITSGNVSLGKPTAFSPQMTNAELIEHM